MSIFQMDRHTGLFVQITGVNKTVTHKDRETTDEWNCEGSCMLT